MPQTVLIVDDHEGFRAQARALLEADGYVVVGQASDGPSGYALARELRPEVVLLDIQLPGMDGVTAVGHLKAEPCTAAIPVVALTAFAMKDDRERFLNAGFDDYLIKPIDVREFPEQVRRYCERTR